jgi:hypothetical protein
MCGRELLYPDYLNSAKETKQYASCDQYVKSQIQRMAKVSDIIRSNARENDVANKKQYNKSTNERIFQVGDHVLYFQHAFPRKGYSKLARRWLECIVVERNANNVNYKLQVKATGQVLKPWIHANYLRPFNLSRDFLAQGEFEIAQYDINKTQNNNIDQTPEEAKLPDGWCEVKRVLSRRKKDG